MHRQSSKELGTDRKWTRWRSGGKFRKITPMQSLKRPTEAIVLLIQGTRPRYLGKTRRRCFPCQPAHPFLQPGATIVGNKALEDTDLDPPKVPHPRSPPSSVDPELKLPSPGVRPGQSSSRFDPGFAVAVPRFLAEYWSYLQAHDHGRGCASSIFGRFVWHCSMCF